MDPNAEGVFDAISEESSAHDPAQEPSADAQETKTEEPKVVPETKTETETPTAKSETETNTEPSQSAQGANKETKTDGETSEPAEATVDWKSLLPQAPGEFQGKTPEIDGETGQITNMTPQEYEDYIVNKAEHRMAQKSYLQTVENTALDQVEKILPEVKENPTLRKAIENQRIADAFAGRDTTIVELAQELRTMLGSAKADGAQNTKVHIETQKVAAVETGNTQTKKDNSKSEDIVRRINRGDNEAFVELLDMWQEDGSI